MSDPRLCKSSTCSSTGSFLVSTSQNNRSSSRKIRFRDRFAYISASYPPTIAIPPLQPADTHMQILAAL
ncbi:uncharacterized protein N7511_009514 [Penicillium nucicola]|uniref:uncharacterized protein n=1 Tax=Penicillium nucicola TaxID=1850975 RepID=UPI00254587F1|nr:uncharacterized protein N7511_009514 [Penicillium nucicola]KAJ5747818.1 hypothetical protein N7511_009514 [Penicillium nucicola]